jgi:hypothetical protein
MIKSNFSFHLSSGARLWTELCILTTCWFRSREEVLINISNTLCWQ